MSVKYDVSRWITPIAYGFINKCSSLILYGPPFIRGEGDQFTNPIVTGEDINTIFFYVWLILYIHRADLTNRQDRVGTYQIRPVSFNGPCHKGLF